MPQLTFSANAELLQGNPFNQQPERDVATLQLYHGFQSEDSCLDYMDPEVAESLGLTGGNLRLAFDPESSRLRVTTTYGLDSKPSPDQLKQLQQETESQWSDGIGGGVFSFLRVEIPSSTLVQAILHQDPEFESELPPHTIDVYPVGDDRQPRSDWSDTGGPYDFLLEDLAQAIVQNNAVAMAELGNYLLNGQIVEQDVERGLGLLSKAVEQNDEFAAVWLAQAFLMGEKVEADYQRAETLLKNANENGSLLAQTFLAIEYLSGKKLSKQRDQAIAMLRDAVEQGDPIAMAELGDCYEFGIGVEADPNTALKYYQESLEMGFEDVEPAFKRVSAQLKKSGGLFDRVGDMFNSLFSQRTDEIDVDEAVVMIKSDDPEMEAAVMNAQAKLNQFIEAVKNPKPGYTTSVKVRFEDGQDVEYMWLNELTYVDGCFTGVINNDPVYVQNVKIGDRHEAHANEVNDWLIVDEVGGLEGGFTIELLQRRQGQA